MNPRRKKERRGTRSVHGIDSFGGNDPMEERRRLAGGMMDPGGFLTSGEEFWRRRQRGWLVYEVGRCW